MSLDEFQPLQQHVPIYYTKGDNIVPLYEPSRFYTELKARILSAKERIFIAALYIGQSEQQLVDVLRAALERNTRLQVHIVIDCLRGTRVSKNESSATLLLPLIQDFANQIRVSMYHTPDLTGMLKRVLPPRFNESIGLMHLKVYGFDDAVMLSGANLSTDYFTNRQDRYMMFERQPDLASYYHRLLSVVGSFSYQLRVARTKDLGYNLVMQDGTPDPVQQSKLFRRQAHTKLQTFLAEALQEGHKEEGYDTAVLPVIQMGPFGIRQDERACLQLLEIAHHQGVSGQPWTIHLTSGYFNFTDRYKRFILRTKACFRFLTAAPEANGFFNSKGVSRFLPPAYTFIERAFYRQVGRVNRLDEISIEEYGRPGWTYHAKGLWIYLSQESLPSLTMVGSPNFGHRSSERDLEAQAVVITQHQGLREALHKEVDLLHQNSAMISSETFERRDRRIPFGVKVAATMIKTML